MGRREFTAALFMSCLPEALCAAGEEDSVLAVRMALQRGAGVAVGLLGRADGFWGNPRVRIGLSRALAEGARLLRVTGQGRRVDELVLAMNRAAETAVPQTLPLLARAVRDMSVEDARSLVCGGETAVTRFFEFKTRQHLYAACLPLVLQATESLSLAQRYNAVAGRATALGLLRGEDASVQQYVTARALDGLYLLIGDEERKLRAKPLETGSAIMNRVFGGRAR